MERTRTLPERVHHAAAVAREAGGNDRDVSEAVCAEVAAYLREEQALWRLRQGGRRWNAGDIQFDSAVTQCADDIDPEMWRYMRIVP